MSDSSRGELWKAGIVAGLGSVVLGGVAYYLKGKQGGRERALEEKNKLARQDSESRLAMTPAELEAYKKKKKESALNCAYTQSCMRHEVVYEAEIGENIVIREFAEARKCNGAPVVEGFPSSGLCASLTAKYLVEQLQLPLVGEIISDAFPVLGVISQYQSSSSTRIYGDERLVVFVTDLKISGDDTGSVTSEIVAAIYDFAQRHRSKMIITVEGILRESAVKQQKFQTQEDMVIAMLDEMNQNAQGGGGGDGGDEEGDEEKDDDAEGDEEERDPTLAEAMAQKREEEARERALEALRKKKKKKGEPKADSDDDDDHGKKADAKKKADKGKKKKGGDGDGDGDADADADGKKNKKKDAKKKGDKGKKKKAKHADDDSDESDADDSDEDDTEMGEVRFVTNDLSLSLAMRRLGHLPFREGQIQGVTGGIISASSTRPENVICILSPYNESLTDARAAIPIIQCIVALLGEEIVIDTTDLEKEIRKVERGVRKALEEMVPGGQASGKDKHVNMMYI